MPPATNVGPTVKGAAPAPPRGAPQYYTTKAEATPHLAAGQTLRFAAGRGYYPGAAPTPNQAAANAAANSNSSLQQYLAYTSSNMGREAQSIVNGMTTPIIQGYTTQQKAGDQSIVGSTQTYVNELQSIGARAEGAYTTAEGQQEALDAAVGSALQNGDVGAAASRLTQSLAAAGQSTVPGAAAQAAANQTGAAQFASGSASLAELFAQGANQTAYDAKQPGIARSAGLQALSVYNAGLTSAEQQAVQQAQDKLPSIMSALNAGAKTQLAAGSEAFKESQAAAKTRLAARAEAFKESQPKIYGNSSTGYFALTADGRNVQLTAPGAKAPKTFGSASTGYYKLDPTTGQVTQLTAPVPKAAPRPGAPHTKTVGGTTYQWNGTAWAPAPGIPPAGRGGSLTPGEGQSYLKSISHTVTETDKTTGQKTVTVQHTTNYPTAYKYLTSRGYSDVQARALLDSSYKRGQDGRAWLTNEEQAALKRYNQTKGKAIKGHPTGGIGQVSTAPTSSGYISARQAAVLKASGQLPPGHFVNADWYAINPNG